MRSFAKKKWVSILAGAGVLVLVCLGLAGRDHIPEARAVRIVRQDLTASITSNGKVEPIQPFVFRAQYPTFVRHVAVTEGQSVVHNQPLLTLDSADIQAELAQARGDLLVAQEDLRAASAGGPPDQIANLTADLSRARIDVQNYQRMQATLQQLVAQHAATQDELEQNQAALARAQATLASLQQRKDDLAQRSRTDAEQARLRVDQATARIASLEQKVRSAVLNAPVPGTLYSLPIHAGDYVQTGDVLAQLADLRQVRVRAFVDEPDLGWLAAGQAVEAMWDAMPGRVWKGVTMQVPRQVVPRGNRSVAEVLCSVDNSQLELLPNVNVNVRIVVRESRNALVVPRAAVRMHGPERYVFALAGDTVRQRTIETGISNATRYQVLSGLTEGDQVVLPGDLNLHDGMPVRATDVELPE
jgi:HlyD family secretion protein